MAELEKARLSWIDDQFERYHAGYMGGPDTADLRRVLNQETKLLQPGGEMVFTSRTTKFYDQPFIFSDISKFTWQVWFLVGDGVWAKSNVVTFEVVDKDVAEDGEIVGYFPRIAANRGADSGQGWPVYRLVVDDEQWFYLQMHRIATLPVGVDPDLYRDPRTGMFWLRFPDNPEMNLQKKPGKAFETMPEYSLPDPDFRIPPPAAGEEAPR